MRLYHAENKLNSDEIISRREQVKFQWDYITQRTS